MEFSRAFHPGKRRATPIPVLPPRIPTPMPLNNNNNARSNKPKEQQQITISTISGGPSAMDMVSGKIQQQPHPHQMHYQNPQMSHHSGPDIPMLITKPSYKLLDNDVKTAWINPRLISKIDMGLIKKTEYASAPPERNMNGGGSCSGSGSGIPATTTIQHHSQQQSRHPACGRLHEREWERGCVSINGRNTVSKSRSVPASIQAASDPRKKRSSGVRMDVHANTNTNINHQLQLQQQKSYIPKSTSRTTRHQHQNQNQQHTQRQRNAQSAERLRTNILGYHHQSETSCYVGAGLTNSAGGVGGVYGIYSETNYIYSVNDSSQAAMFFARAAQKLNLSSPHRRKRYNSEDENQTGFCGALQRCPPSVPPALLRRIGVKEVTGVGKVKVMLRVSSSGQNPESGSSNSFFSLDKRKKQVTLIDPSACNGSTPEDRKVGVAAPKMFAFDAIFSQDDSQTEICSSALTDVIHAVINGTDGCLFCFGHAGLGKSYTMLGTPDNANTLGIIPCAISWLFKGINEQKQKTGARFSVRVSAVEVCGPSNQLRDLLAGYSNDSEQSPGVYLRDDPLFGNHPPHCELRVPTAEKAAHYLDAAVECRTGAPPLQAQAKEDARDSHLLFTLHVYQYSVAGKGGVAGGRSRLHLIDLGNSERGKASGGIPLSGVGNILLGIFNGQKHLPYKEHKLTHLLKDCLSSLTCHAAMIAHVSPYAQNYSDTLTTVQLASRIHRMRRRRIKFVSAGTGNGSGGSSGEEATRTTGTSSEPDPSSSDLSADTVIYVGPTDDATDGEHPPVYIPSLNSGDNRCSMSKILRGSSAEQKPKPSKVEEKPSTHRPKQIACQSNKTSPAHTNSPKQSPSRIPSIKNKPVNGGSDEQWIDGPRISKSKVAEARHLMKEVCHVKKRETWIDGPMQAESNVGYGYMDSHKKNMIRQWVEHQTSQIVKVKHGHNPKPHKEMVKEMTQFKCEEEVLKPLDTKKQEVVEESTIRTGLKINSSQNEIIPECVTPEDKEPDEEVDDEEEPVEMPPPLPLIQPLSSREVSLESLDQLLKERMLSNAEYNSYQNNVYEEHVGSDDEVLEIIEVEEPLEPVPTQDCCLQVTEEDIALCMGFSENPLPEVDQEHILDHPLRILSQENLTVVSTFTDSMSVYTDLERILPRHRYDRYNLYNDDYEDPDNPYQRNGNYDETTKKKFDQLAKLHELFSNRLAKANVANSETYQLQKQNHKTLTRCESLTLNDMLYGDANHDNSSIYSEPAYTQQKFCENCKVNISRPATAQNWYTDTYLSASTYDLQDIPHENNLSGRFQRYSHSHKYKDNNLAYLRHPDGASNPNLREDSITVQPLPPPNSLPSVERMNRAALSLETGVTAIKLTQKSEGYDSGHDSTPRTSKHSPAAISRRAESGYDSVVRDSESSSIDSDTSRLSHLRNRRGKCKHKHEKSFCSWFLNPFTCKYIDEPPETHF